MTIGTHWLFWDGECDFCRRAVGWVRSRDHDHLFLIVPYQEAPTPPMTPELYLRSRQAVQVLCPDGTLIAGGHAVGFILQKIGWRHLGKAMNSRLVSPLTEWCYRFVARHRGIIGRILFRRSCSVE